MRLEPSEPATLVSDPDTLAHAAAQLGAAAGPVAVDAERASGFRYGQRAYLIQVRRDGAGTFLVDPIACPDLSGLQAAISDAEWVLHAASQDLPCLSEVGLQPTRIFDTELAGRLLGRERVGLAAMVEAELGLILDKEHSAADWSTRPLPESWLRYAALDVEVLVELRDLLEAHLASAGKLEWAHEEFEWVLRAPPPAPRQEPWRRTSGIHRVRTRRSLAIVRDMWTAREELGQRLDVSPGRLLPDASIVEVATAQPESADRLLALPGFTGRARRQRIDTWWRAVATARDAPEADLPAIAASTGAIPPPKSWKDRDPEAAARLAAVRAALTELAEEHSLPLENLLQPELVRRACWEWGHDADRSSARLDSLLREGNARAWQASLCRPVLAAQLPVEDD